MNATAVKLTGGTTNARLRCTTCRHMGPAYVDRGDGQPLRYGTEYGTDGCKLPDPTLDRGACVPAYVALDDTCPNCGARDHDLWPGRGFESLTLKVTRGISACDAFCATATGATCKCQCAGANHGTR